ncbi:MAG: hypothetical protein ACKOHG_21310 [Planctomycetia bacterium]
MFSARDPADLDRFFRGLAEHAFHGQLGVVDPPLVEYVSSLLVRFMRAEGLRPLPAADAVAVDDYRQIGDYTLFWTGLYPEALRRVQQLDYRLAGKRAYWIASTLEPDDAAAERLLLERLSHEYDVCVAGLAEVRRAWGE